MNQQPKDDTAVRASLELLYHISRELSSSLDLRSLLQRVLFLSMRTVGASSGTVVVLDEVGQPVESALIAGGAVHDHTTSRLRVTLENGLAGWVAKNRQAALVPDTSQDERWLVRQYPDGTNHGPKSAVSAPLIAREKLVGVITLSHPTPAFFNQEHLELVQAIADQAGIAVLNARLYEDSQRQARVMTMLASSATGITISLNLEDVFDGIIQQIKQGLNTDTCSLALIDTANGKLAFQAASGQGRNAVLHTQGEFGQGIAGWVAEHGEGLAINQVEQDERYHAEVDGRVGYAIKSLVCAPIRYRGEVIGVLEALNPQQVVIDPDALLILSGIGSLAGTAIRHAQLFEQLQAAHKSYRDLFEDSIDPILITNMDGEILQANRKAVLAAGFDQDVLRHMNIAQIHQVAWEQLGDGYKNVTPGVTCSYESKIISPNRRDLPIEVYVRQIKTDHSIHLQWILRDITAHKNLDELRNDLISMIYHDLRSPLANVVSSLDVLISILPAEQDQAVKSLLEIALRSTERIQRLTDSLLDMSRLEAGQPIGNRQLSDIALLAKEAVEAIIPIAVNKGQRMSNAVPGDLPAIYVDPDMIRRVITNLLENATKYIPPEGHIQVGARQDGEKLVVWVEDDGPGILPAEKERIFEKFNRLATQEGPQGLGLGLAYCRLAVQGHGGRIWVDSEPGKGSRFHFTLPLTKDTNQG